MTIDHAARSRLRIDRNGQLVRQQVLDRKIGMPVSPCLLRSVKFECEFDSVLGSEVGHSPRTESPYQVDSDHGH